MFTIDLLRYASQVKKANELRSSAFSFSFHLLVAVKE